MTDRARRSEEYFTSRLGCKVPDREWLLRNATNPHWAKDEWARRIDKTTKPEATVRTALAVALGLADSAMNHYIFYQTAFDEFIRKDSQRRLSVETIWAINQLSLSLGGKPDRALEKDLEQLKKFERGSRQHAKGKRPLKIAVLAGMEDVPSPRFHLTVLAELVRVGEQRGYALEIHDLGATSGQTARLGRILRTSSVHGIVWLRSDPTDEDLACVAGYPDPVPVVLIHCSLVAYGKPVIAHVLPGQEKLKEGVQRWAASLPAMPGGDNEVVIATMKVDSPSNIQKRGRPISIREERVSAIRAGVQAAGLTPREVLVNGYAAHYGYDLVKEGARGYACLSDEIALAVHALLPGGCERTRRVLGFDGCQAARDRGIPTFDQHLPDLGAKVIGQFDTWFRAADPRWTACKRVAVRVTLSGLH